MAKCKMCSKEFRPSVSEATGRLDSALCDTGILSSGDTITNYCKECGQKLVTKYFEYTTEQVKNLLRPRTEQEFHEQMQLTINRLDPKIRNALQWFSTQVPQFRDCKVRTREGSGIKESFIWGLEVTPFGTKETYTVGFELLVDRIHYLENGAWIASLAAHAMFEEQESWATLLTGRNTRPPTHQAVLIADSEGVDEVDEISLRKALLQSAEAAF